MGLLTNSLYLDSEYKADCEKKINYILFLEDSSTNTNTNNQITINEISNGVSNNNYSSKDESNNILYRNKQISDTYYKILFEKHENEEVSD